MRFFRRSRFTGSNNIAKPERLPMEEGAGPVVDAVNMDFTVGGKMELRTGFTRIMDADGVRAVFGHGEGLVLVVGDKLVQYADGVATEISEVSPGPVAAVSHNGELFLNTLNQSIRISGGQVAAWGVRPPAFDVDIVSGSMQPGVYRVAVTAMDGGVESGCTERVISLGEGSAIRVSVSDGRPGRLYCSPANSSTLYYQGDVRETNLISSVMDGSARCDTAGLEPMPFCSILVSHRGVIVGADGRYLYHTRPMRPNLHNPETDWVAYPAPITLIAAVEGGVFVCADKTYFLSGIGGEWSQRDVLEFGAVAGTAVQLPNGSASWFCQYGQVIGGPDGSADLINRASYAPDIAEQGAAGFLEHNGNQMVVTTMRGEAQSSRLRAGDFWSLEVIDNE